MTFACRLYIPHDVTIGYTLTCLYISLFLIYKILPCLTYTYSLWSFCRINYHLEVKCPEEGAKMEEEFAEVIKARGDDFKFYQDQ